MCLYVKQIHRLHKGNSWQSAGWCNKMQILHAVWPKVINLGHQQFDREYCVLESSINEEDEINVPMALSVFRDEKHPLTFSHCSIICIMIMRAMAMLSSLANGALTGTCVVVTYLTCFGCYDKKVEAITVWKPNFLLDTRNKYEG